MRRLPELSLLAASALLGCGDSFEVSGAGGGSGAAASTTTDAAATGATSAGSTAASGGACDAAAGACAACGHASCNAEYCACAGDPQCGELLACYADPSGGTPQWVQYCNTKYAGSISAAALLLHCDATECASDCGSPGGALDPCEECLFRECASEMNACFGVVECALYLQCTTGCPPGDEVCTDACVSMHADGADLAADVVQCAVDSCPTQCGG